MNKIYKLVWSKVRNTCVVASEIAKGHGKNASATGERKLLKTAVITAIMGVSYDRRFGVCGTDTGATSCI